MCVGGFSLVRLSTATIYLLYSTTTTTTTTTTTSTITVNYYETTTTVTGTGDDDASQLETAGNALKGFYPTFHNRFSRNALVTRRFHNPHNTS